MAAGGGTRRGGGEGGGGGWVGGGGPVLPSAWSLTRQKAAVVSWASTVATLLKPGNIPHSLSHPLTLLLKFTLDSILLIFLQFPCVLCCAVLFCRSCAAHLTEEGVVHTPDRLDVGCRQTSLVPHHL